MTITTTAPIWCEAVCLRCASTVGGNFAYEKLPRRRIAKAAKDAGWKVVDDDWLCKSCARKATKE